MGVLSSADFRLLWISQGSAMLGGQMLAIALPWLVVQTAGGPLFVGTVLAVAATPRAIFVLLGGAAVDRLSPHRVLVLSSAVRLLAVATFAAVLIGQAVAMPAIYAFALCFGLADALFIPAVNALVPQLVDEARLRVANMVISGTGQITAVVGPAAAGLAIGLLPRAGPFRGASDHLPGIAVPFLCVALALAASTGALLRMKIRHHHPRAARDGETAGILALAAQGLRDMWRQPLLRTLFILVCAINLLMTGPVFVGLPVLAATRYTDGAAIYGMLMSSFGAGAIGGVALAGVLPPLPPQHMGVSLMAILGTLGIGLMLLGLNSEPTTAAATLAVMGCANGYATVVLVTLLQSRTPVHRIGRTMGVMALALFGVTPVSNALAGYLIVRDIAMAFVLAGFALACLVAISAFRPAVRAMGIETTSL